MELQKWTVTGRQFFSKGSRPSKRQWIDWISSEAVMGKIICGEPFIDIDHFAANDILEPMPQEDDRIDLLE